MARDNYKGEGITGRDNGDTKSPVNTSEEKPKFEEGLLAEVIFRASDISQLAKWPLLVLAFVCWSCAAVTWYAKEDWPRFFAREDMAYLMSFLSLTAKLVVFLKFGLVICFIIVLASLILFIFLFFENRVSRMLREAVNVLLSNSFYFGVALIFVLLATAGRREAAGQIADTGTQKIQCTTNLKKLGRALIYYARKNYHHYPPPDRWCDLLIEHKRVKQEGFRCAGAAKGRCHYALNPNAEPISRYENFDNYLESHYYDQKRRTDVDELRLWHPTYRAESSSKRYVLPKLVLLFETKTGWNQSGEDELLTTENHEGRGCNILFNDGRVQFVPTERLEDLRWKFEDSNSVGEGFSK
jgi:prepilin-type processing-associated H-X9-DG protein